MIAREEETRLCSGPCGRELPIGEFSQFTEHGTTRRRGQCRACRREKRRETRLRRRHQLTRAALRQIAEAKTDQQVKRLADALVRSLIKIGLEKELERFFLAEWRRSNYALTRAMRATGRTLCVVTKINQRPQGALRGRSNGR
jgi:methylphosphotriester-DNA--protein-cysteine methyltransferase